MCRPGLLPLKRGCAMAQAWGGASPRRCFCGFPMSLHTPKSSILARSLEPRWVEFDVCACDMVAQGHGPAVLPTLLATWEPPVSPHCEKLPCQAQGVCEEGAVTGCRQLFLSSRQGGTGQTCDTALPSCVLTTPTICLSGTCCRPSVPQRSLWLCLQLQALSKVGV